MMNLHKNYVMTSWYQFMSKEMHLWSSTRH